MQSDRHFFVLVRAHWWKTFSCARIGECLTGKWATHTLVCAKGEFPRCAYFAAALVYRLPEIVITSKVIIKFYFVGASAISMIPFFLWLGGIGWL